jgi:hypothetical protein
VDWPAIRLDTERLALPPAASLAITNQIKLALRKVRSPMLRRSEGDRFNLQRAEMLVYATRRRRTMTGLANVRRRIQKLSPYSSLALLLVPIALVEPLKLVALFVAGEGALALRHRNDPRSLFR